MVSQRMLDLFKKPGDKDFTGLDMPEEIGSAMTNTPHS